MKQLAMATHPDTAGKEMKPSFQKIQKAYENLDVPTLIGVAEDLSVTIDLTDSDMDSLKSSIELKNSELIEKRKTIRWVWCNSEKSPALRKQIWSSLGIDKRKYKQWLQNAFKESQGLSE